MRKKLFGKLLSVALSATMAVTSAVPAYAADSLALSETKAEADAVEETEEAADNVTNASEPETESEEKAENGEGEEVEPEEIQDEGAPKEEEATEEVNEDAPEEEVVAEEGTTLEGEDDEDEELPELDSTKDVTITFTNALDNGIPKSNLYFYNPQKENAEIFDDGAKIKSDDKIEWDSEKDYFEFYVKPIDGYVLDTSTDIVKIFYQYNNDNQKTVNAEYEAGFSVEFENEDTKNKTAKSASVKISSAYLREFAEYEKKHVDGELNEANLNVYPYFVRESGNVVYKAAKPATFYIQTDNLGLSATSNLVHAKYGEDLAAITLTDDVTNPITSVKMYKDYGTSKQVEIKSTSNAYNDNDDDADYFYFEKGDGPAYATDKKLYIFVNGVNYAYSNDITFVGVSESYAISQKNATASGVTLSFKEGANSSFAGITTSTNVGALYDVDADSNSLYVGQTSSVTGRTATELDVTITFDDGTSKTLENYSATTTGTDGKSYFKIPVSYFRTIETVGNVAKLKTRATNVDIAVSKTTETVNWTSIASGNYSVDGASVTSTGRSASLEGTIEDGTINKRTAAETGKAYSFKLATSKNGYKIGNVYYRLEGTTNLVPVTIDASGTGTIPSNVVNKQITMYVELAESSLNVSVKAGKYTNAGGNFVTNNSGDYELIDKETGTSISTASGTNLATKGEDYFFTVNNASEGAYTISNVKYTTNNDDIENAEDATKVEGFTDLYMIPLSTIDEDVRSIELYVETVSAVSITVPTNPAVQIEIGGKTYKGGSGATVKWEKNKALTYKISKNPSYDATVTIAKVTTTITVNTTDTKEEYTPNAASYEGSVTSTAMKGNLKIEVSTKEVPNSYALDFDGTNDGTNVNKPFKGTINNENVDNEKKGMLAYTKVGTKYNINKPYELLVNQNTTVAAIPQITKFDSDVDGDLGDETAINPYDAGVTATYSKAATDKIITVAKNATNSLIEVTGEKEGSDTVNIKYVVSKGSGNETREIEFTGTLNVTVKPHYVVKLVPDSKTVGITAKYSELTGPGVKADESKKDSTTTTKITAQVYSGATGEELNSDSTHSDYVGRELTTGVTKATFKWNKTEENANYFIVDGTEYGASANAAKALEANVSAESVSTTPGKFNITITDTDKAEYSAETPCEITAVTNHNYVMIPTLSLDGGGKVFGSKDNNYNDDHDMDIALGVTKLNKATITYKVYDLGTGTNSVVLTSQASIDTALKLCKDNEYKPDNAAYIADVTEDADFTVTNYTTNSISEYNTTHDKSDLVVPSWLAVSGNGNTRTLIASDKQDGTAKVTTIPTIYGITLASQVYEVTVNNEFALVDVGLKINDSEQLDSNDKVITQKFSTSYLDGINWYSVGYNNNEPSGTEDGRTNGYLFKLTKGSVFTLPSETDLADTTYTDKTRMIAYWTVTTENNATIYRADSANTAVASSSGYVMSPGEKFVVNGDVTKIEATWANKYEVSLKKKTINTSILYGAYRYGAGLTIETEDKTYNNDAIDEDGIAKAPTTSKVTGPVNSEVIYLDSTNDSVKITEGANVALGLAVREYRRVNGGVYNTIYPAYDNNGTVNWYAYDGSTYAGDESVYDTEAKQKAAREKQTLLDPDQLAKGILSPKDSTNGSNVWVYATYTRDGVTYGDESNGIAITIDGKKPTYYLSAAKLPTSVEVGGVVGTTHGTDALVITKGGLNIGTTAKGTFEYIVSDETILSVEKGTKPDEVIITGLKTGKATVNAKYTDENGVSVTSDDGHEIEVKAAAVEILFVNKDGSTNSDALEAQVGSTTDNNIIFTAKYTSDKKDYVQDGTWSFKTVTKSGSANIRTGDIIAQPTGAVSSNIKQLQATQDKYVGSYTLTLTFSYTEGTTTHKYTKTADVKTYNTLVFRANENGTGSAYVYPYLANEALVTNVAKDTENQSKVGVTDANGTLQVDSDGKYVNYTLKIFEEDLNSNKDQDDVYQGFNVDLSNYKAEYKGTDVNLSFAGWVGTQPAVETNGSKSDTSINTKGTLLETAKNADARYDQTPTYVYPLFMDEAVSSIETNVTTGKIVLSNEDKATTGGYKGDSQEIEIYVSPKASVAQITAQTKNSNRTGTSDAVFVMNEVSGSATTKSADEKIDFSAVTPATKDTSRKYVFNVTSLDGKVGTNTIEISAAGSTATTSVDVLVYGIYTKNASKRYMKSNGEDLVNSAITVNDQGNNVTYYFDDKGYEIIKKGPAYDAEGNLVLLSGTTTGAMKVVTTDGLHKDGDTEGNAYYTIDGVIQTGLFTAKDGKQYVATKDGIFITYAMTTAAGTPGKYTVDGTVYVIDTDNTAEADHEHKWTANWVWDTNTYASATLTLTCVKGEVITQVVNSELVSKSGTVYTYKVTYEYANETYSDTKIVTKASDTAKPEEATDISEGQGIVIVGIDEDGYDYTGQAIQPLFDVIDAGSDHAEAYTLIKGVDYTVSYKNNRDPGTTAEIIVKGKGNYSGQAATKNFKILDPAKTVAEDTDSYKDLKGAKLALPKETFYFNNTYQYPSSLTLTLKNQSAVTYISDGQGGYADEDGNAIPAVVTFSNNVNKGTATVLLTGLVNGSKNTTLKKTFSIKAAELTSGNTTVEVEDKDWAAKGATPNVTVTYAYKDADGAEQTLTLIEGLEYTVKYNNNKKVQTATVSITGKGNFSKTVKDVAKFNVTPLELVDGMIKSATVYDQVKVSSVKATVLDDYGDVIPASKYQITVSEDGKELGKSEKLVAGHTYTVKVAPNATEFAADSSAERDFTAQFNLNKATVKLGKGYSQTYTGDLIYIPDEDFENGNITVTAKINGSTVTLKQGDNFTVDGYTNNLKKGTMTVTITGTGEADSREIAVSGTKTFKVKIVAKKLTK